MGIRLFSFLAMIGDSLPINGESSGDVAWYLRTIKLFTVFEVPLIFVLIIGVLIVSGIIFFILQGYFKEIKRQKELAAKAQAKAKAKSKKKGN